MISDPLEPPDGKCERGLGTMYPTDLAMMCRRKSRLDVLSPGGRYMYMTA